MENFLLKLLNMSLTGSYVILAVLLLRVFLRAAPRWVSYALWAVPFLRLALPFSLESAFSLVRVRPNAIPADIAYAAQPAIDSGVRPLDTVVNTALTAAAPDVTAGNSVNPMQVLLFVCFWLWLAGVICLAVSSLVQTVRLRRYLRTARHIGGNLYEIGRADTPFVFGFLKPRIYLPAGLNGAEYDYILAHERHHIKRFDHILRPLAFCVTAAHWFNPLVWLAYRLLSADMEQSCDEAVLRRFGADIRKAYSASLVGLATVPRARQLGPLGFAENDIARRVKRILHWKRPALWLTVLAACAAVVVGCGLMSNPIAKQSAEAPETSYEDPVSSFAFSHMECIETVLDDYFEIVHRGYGLEELGTVNTLLDSPLTIYRCDAFYVPADHEAARKALEKNAIEANFVENGDQYEIRDIPGMSRIYYAHSEDFSFGFGSNYDQRFSDYPNESISNLELLAREWLEKNHVYSEATETAHLDSATDYALMYMSQVETLLSQYFEISHRGYGIQEHAVIDGLLDEPLTVHQLDVYYIPEDYEIAREALSKTPIEAKFVKNGNQFELVDWIDGGWTLGGDEYVITDASNYCHIYFTILPDGSIIQFDRLHYDGEISSKEYLKSLLRTQLEIRGLLKPPTFKSTHYVVTYEEYHPGVMKKLLLSQPAKQGEGGIWCVERMMDENGNEHISTPQNYTALQKECNEGHKPWMLDPEQVALEYIRQTYNTARIVEIKEGTYENFQAWPASTYTGYITDIDLETNHLKLMPTVSDENGAPVLWAKGYPEYYDYLPFYEELTVWTVNGARCGDTMFEENVEKALADGEPGLFTTCTYYAGYIQKAEAVYENSTFHYYSNH